MTMMVRESGQKKNCAIYRYYKCASAKRKKGCNKKAIRKEWIEDYVINKLLSILDDSDVLNDMADMLIVFRSFAVYIFQSVHPSMSVFHFMQPQR
jgi:hypothetical protein